MEKLSDDQMMHIKGVIEALLFISEKPVTLDQIRKVLETVAPSDIKRAIKELMDSYEENKKGVALVEIAGGYQMLSSPLYVSYVRSFYKTKHKEKLSKPALEALAIIAYKQPVTRGDIEIIRGVNSDGVTSHLVNKELIKIVGRKDTPGKPFLYGTTKQFMEYFGLKSLDDLPKIEEFTELAERTQEERGQTEEPVEEETLSENMIPGSEVPMNELEQMKQGAISQEMSKDSEESNTEVLAAAEEQEIVELNQDEEKSSVGEADISESQAQALPQTETEQTITAVLEQNGEENDKKDDEEEK